MFLESSPNIVVVGAGFSGLTCAYRLEQAGFHPKIYEARNRTGGRVLSVNITGHTAELGAENILDGGEAHHLLALAKELGLETEYCAHDRLPKYDTGKTLVDVNERLKKRDINFDSLETLASSCTNLGELLAAFFADDDVLFKAFKGMIAAYEGAPLHTLSPNAYDTLYYILTGGLSQTHQARKIEFRWIKGGNSCLAEKLAENLKTPIAFNHILTHIKKGPQGGYNLTFGNGTKVHCDILILSLPPPVYADISIDETLVSNERKNAIQTINFGTNCKIIQPISENEFSPGLYINDRMVSYFGGSKALLTIYYVDSIGLFDASNINEVLQQDLPTLKRALGISPAQAPVVAEEKPFASYAGPVGHSWLNDPFAKGSYSSIGTKDTKEEMESLFQPINGSLYFIGEHTTLDPNILGTMEAAVESGDRTAKIIRSKS